MSYLKVAKIWKASRSSPVETKSTPNYELNEINEITPNDISEYVSEAAKVSGQLERTGVTRIRSGVLTEDICFANDETAAGRVKHADPGTTVYTLAELEELARGNPTRDGLRQVHEAKKLFNGKVVENDKAPNHFTPISK